VSSVEHTVTLLVGNLIYSTFQAFIMSHIGSNVTL